MQRFATKIERGQVIPQSFMDAVAHHWEVSDRPLILTATEEKKARSTGEGSQNHHLNGHIQQICEETGNDFHDVKKYIKTQALKRGYPVRKDAEGFEMVDIWGDPMPISETDSNTAECSMLIDEVHILASELGIVLREEI